MLFIVTEHDNRQRFSSYMKYLVDANSEEEAINQVKGLIEVVPLNYSYDVEEIDVTLPYEIFDSTSWS